MTTPSCPSPVQWEPTPEDPTTQWTVSDVNECFAITYEVSEPIDPTNYDSPLPRWDWQVFDGHTSEEIASGSATFEGTAKRAASEALLTRHGDAASA